MGQAASYSTFGVSDELDYERAVVVAKVAKVQLVMGTGVATTAFLRCDFGRCKRVKPMLGAIGVMW